MSDLSDLDLSLDTSEKEPDRENLHYEAAALRAVRLLNSPEGRNALQRLVLRELVVCTRGFHAHYELTLIGETIYQGLLDGSSYAHLIRSEEGRK